MSDHRCRWCGSHNVGRNPPQFDRCRARLNYEPCVEWKPDMPRWPQFIEPHEYVDEETCEIRPRPPRG